MISSRQISPVTFTRLLIVSLLLGATGAESWGAETKTKGAKGPQRWNETVQKFVAADAANPPPKGGLLLVGGSNARRWTDLADYFPGQKVLNRGFGGAQLSEVLFFADQIILPYAPSAIIVNGGGNDLSAGKSPEAVRDAARALLERVRAELPGARIYYIAVPPVLRAAKTPDGLAVIRRTNALMAELARAEDALEFIDLFPRFLGSNGQPRAELFVEDGTHFSAQGYAIVAELVREKMRR